MWKDDKSKRPRGSASADEEAGFNPAALAFATWLALLIVVRVIALLPSAPMASAPQVWTSFAFAT